MRTATWLIIISFAFPLSVPADELVLGVLEEPQCKEGHQIAARLLFAKVGKRWVALNDEYEMPKNINLTLPNWTIAFDGRRLGSVKLRDPNPEHPRVKDWYYGRDKLYEPENLGKVPTVRNKSPDFAGWCEAPMVRPLVLVSKANFGDPEKWKPFSPDLSYKTRLYVPLKQSIGQYAVMRCVKDSEHPEPWDYKPEDLVLYRSYRSASGKELVAIGIDLKKVDCDFMAEPQLASHWFMFDSDKIEFLGTNMELVDSGDYDGDGRSELLFWYSGYNKDGYILVYNGVRQKTEYLWSYH